MMIVNSRISKDKVMCVYMYIYIYIYLFVCVYVYIYIYICIYTYLQPDEDLWISYPIRQKQIPHLSP